MQLSYSRFYVRTALYIGGALAAFVVVGALSFGAIATWELQGYVETRHSTLAHQAAEVLRERGEPGLIDWMREEANVPNNVSVYILNSNSTDLLGKTIPAQYANFIRDYVIGSTPENDNFQPVRLAPRIVSADGTSYAFLVIPKGVSLWGSNATVIGLLLVAIMVIVSVAWLIARTISRPVSELQMAVRELASGDVGVRVPESISSRNDELGALAADFNRMAGRLQQLIEGRESLFQEMSHELRSPLARLQAAIELAAERNESPVSERGQIELEIARMNRVIGEMLRYSSLDNQVTIKQQLLRVNRRLQDIVATEQVEASNAGCELQLDAEPDLTIIGDPELISRGFENIIRNAIRFAPAGSRVSIQAWRESDAAGQPQIAITVKDSGPGIDAEQLQRVFEPYVKLNAGQNSQPSTGLGLAIVKRVVERHHGSVTADNRDGGGLCVTVRLPAAELS